jgi:hypothetical protein
LARFTPWSHRFFEVSDELWHYPMVKTLADGEGLPVQNPSNPGPWRQEGSQPPLYYFLMALATRWIDTSDVNEVRWINPHADNGVITQDGNNNIIIHTDRENWPWHGTVLAVRLIRLLGVLMGAGTVYFTYRLAREALPGQPGTALAAAAFTAFTPMFVFISASVNNDNLAVLLAAAALWLMARWLREGGARSAYELACYGNLAGRGGIEQDLGTWSLAFRGRALLFGPLMGVLRRQPLFARLPFTPPIDREPRYRIRLSSLLLVFVPALLVSGWWFVRNVGLYGDWLGWSAFIDTVGRRPHPATLPQLWGERVGFCPGLLGIFWRGQRTDAGLDICLAQRHRRRRGHRAHHRRGCQRTAGPNCLGHARGLGDEPRLAGSDNLWPGSLDHAHLGLAGPPHLSSHFSNRRPGRCRTGAPMARAALGLRLPSWPS